MQPYGFKDESELVRTLLDRLSAVVAQQRLCESADLYAQFYKVDHATQQWTEAALSGWPTFGRSGRRKKEDRP